MSIVGRSLIPKMLRQGREKSVSVVRLTLPEGEHTPAQGFDRGCIRRIAGLVAGDLRPPKIESGLRELAVSAAVAVPEAAMHEDGEAMPGKHDIRLSGQVLAVQAKAIAKTEESAAHDQFGAGVLASDGLHDPPALLGGAGIHD
jgi:hypothetical protein